MNWECIVTALIPALLPLAIAVGVLERERRLGKRAEEFRIICSLCLDFWGQSSGWKKEQLYIVYMAFSHSVKVRTCLRELYNDLYDQECFNRLVELLCKSAKVKYYKELLDLGG